MGSWSSKPFGNDTACDWMYQLEKCPNGTLIINTLEKIQQNKNDLTSSDCEEIIAAATVVMAASKREIRGVPQEVKQWINERGYVPNLETISLSIESVSQIVEESELLDLWSEDGNPKSWMKNTNQVLGSLKDVDAEKIPDRRPKPRSIPRTFYKLIEHPDIETNPKIKKIIRRKLEEIVDIDEGTKDTNFYPPLSLLAKYGLIEEAKLLIQKGGDIDVSNLNASQPITYACAYNHIEMAKFLINSGASVNIELSREDSSKFIYSPALLSSVSTASPEIIDLLIENGADLFQQDLNGETLLHKSAESGNLDVLKHLIKLGLDVNKVKGESGESTLHYAVRGNQLEACEILLKSGANPNLIDKFEGKEHQWKITPLDMLDKKENPELYSLLKKYGAKLASEV